MSAMEKSCGPCQACCVALKINSPRLRKKSGIPCRHLVQRGCGIYEGRPPVCRQFLCGWRLLPELDSAWRPDRCGMMLLRLAERESPKAYRAGGLGWVLVILDGEKAFTPRLARFVAGLVKRRMAVFLSAMTPRLQVNEQLESLATANNLDGILATLRHTHTVLLPAGPGGGIGRIWSLYRAQVDRLRTIMEQRQR